MGFGYVLTTQTFASPTIAARSVHAASRFIGAVLCFGGTVAARGKVEAVDGGSGLSVPK